MFSTPFNTKQSFGESNFSTQCGLFSKASLGNLQKSINKEKKRNIIIDRSGRFNI